MMKKCDVIIPVYNAPEWVNLCVYSLIVNTPRKSINKIYLMDDNSNSSTKDCLKKIQEKYSDLVVLITNDNNLGFVKNCNKGLKLSSEDSKSDYVLLLNTDCLVSKNTIPKLVSHIETDENIGLICPISSNAANLTLDMYEGFSFIDMDRLLERKFKGMSFDACTVVGNCLLITKKCMEKVGFLDEIYGMGYGEETDYQFKSLKKGFKAKVAIDTYVFHKSEVSFGTSKEKQEKLAKNREIFFSRWKDDYERCMEEYEQNDPLKYIHDNITDEDKKISVDTLFYLPDIHQNAGGCHVISDLVNYMSINGYSANILYNNIIDYKEIMLFNPISVNSIDNVEVSHIVSTIWASAYSAYKICKDKKVPLISFVQGYEPYFENANIYGMVELSYKLCDSILTISNYLSDKLKDVFKYDSRVIRNAISYNLHYNQYLNTSRKNITLILRGNVMKGDFILMDLLKIIDNNYKDLKVNIVYMNQYIEFPKLSNTSIEYNFIKGPVDRSSINKLLKDTDIYVDASMNEGFGLTALEAMTAGVVPIVSNSFGINEYIIDGENGFIINEVNDVSKYLSKLDILLKDEKIYSNMQFSGIETTKTFDIEDRIFEYIDYFKNCKKLKFKEKKLTVTDLEIVNSLNSNNKKIEKRRSFIYKVNKIIPKSIKEKLKNIITMLYNMYQH